MNQGANTCTDQRIGRPMQREEVTHLFVGTLAKRGGRIIGAGRRNRVARIEDRIEHVVTLILK